jgi:outer membrane protein
MQRDWLAGLIGFFSLIALVPSANADGQRFTLTECFQAAIRRSETIANQDELITQAEERYKQAVGSVLPTVAGVLSYYQQEKPNSGLSSNISPATQKTAKITGTQYLFQGLREYAAFRQTKNLISAQESSKKEALLALYESTAQSYYSVLSAEKVVQNLKSEIPLYEKWIKQLRQWIQIGRSRAPDVLTIEASLAQLQAQLEQALLTAQANREAFSFITGLPSTTKLVDDVDLSKPVIQLPDALNVIQRRPEIATQRFNILAAQEQINIAKGGHLPSLGLTGEYFLARPGYQTGVDWDFQLTLNIPIYQGGVIQSQVRTAASQERQAELTLSQNQRKIDQNIRTIHASVIQDRAQVKALSTAKDVAFRSYESQTHDYKLGLVTNIDVLQALTSFAQSEQALGTARYTAQYDYSRLQAETGQTDVLKF